MPPFTSAPNSFDDEVHVIVDAVRNFQMMSQSTLEQRRPLFFDDGYALGKANRIASQ